MVSILRDAVIRFALDKSKMREAKQGLASLEKSMEGVEDAAQSAKTQLGLFARAAAGGGQGGFGFGGASALLRGGGGKVNYGRLLGVGGQLLGSGGAGELLRTGADLNDLIESIGGMSPVLLAGAAGIGLLGAALGDLSNKGKIATRDLRYLSAGLEQWAAATIGTTRQQLEAQRDAAQLQLDQLKAQQALLNKVITEGYEQTAEGLGVFTGAAIEIGGLLSVGGLENVREARLQLDGLNEKVGQAEFNLGLLNAALADNATATKDAEEAERLLAEAHKADLDKLYSIEEARVRKEVELQDFLRTASAEQVQSRIEDLQKELEIQEQLKSLVTLLYGPEAGAAKLEELERNIGNITQDLGDLGEALREKSIGESIREFTEGLLGASEALQTKAQEVKERLLQEAEDRNARLIDVQKGYEEDLKGIEQDALEERLQIQEDYNNSIVDIAKQASEDAAQALRDYKRQYDQLLQDAERENQTEARRAEVEQATARLEAQREETKALRDHYRDLEQIRRNARRQEADLILQRDFAGLFQLRRNTTYQLEDANRGFSEERDERRAQLKENLDDMRRNFEVERQERQIQFQQRLSDAKTEYEQERAEIERSRVASLEQARSDRQRELAEVAADLNRQRVLRQAKYREELQQAALYANQRMKIDAQVNSAYLARAKATLNAIAGTPITVRPGLGLAGGGMIPISRPGRAFGGNLDMGQLSRVNERRREMAGGAWLPAGPGLFLPTQPTTIRNPGAPSANFTINVHGAQNPELVAQLVRDKVVDVLEEVMS